MITIDFKFNKEALLRQLEQRAANLAIYLANRPNKTFNVTVEGKDYLCRYEVTNGNQVTLYAQVTASVASSMVSPTLTLSLGSILLPECMTLPDDINTLAAPDYQPTHEISYNGLSTNEIKLIFAKIQELGFLNILEKS